MANLSLQRGYILLIVPMVVIAIVMLGYQMVSRSKTSMRIAASELDYLNAKFCSQQCMSLAANRIQKALEDNNQVARGEFPCRCESDNASDPSCTAEIGDRVEKTQQSCYGYYYKSTEVELQAQCRGSRTGKAELEETVGYQEIPIFQFAVFYENELVLEAASPMDLRGKVHSNGDIRIAPGNAPTRFHDWLTTPKTILVHNDVGIVTPSRGFSEIHLAKMDGSGPDPFPVRPANNAYIPLDAVVSNWSAWRKQHRVAYAGQPNGCGPVRKLSLPIRKLEAYITLIEGRMSSDDDSRRRQKFAWKSSLIYKDDWTDKDLRPVAFPANPITPPAAPAGWQVAVFNGKPRVTFWDGREKLMVKLIPIDVDRLQRRSPADSIIYLFDMAVDPAQGNRIVGGFLLHNGKRLVRPLTIATNSRIYTLGDYNTDSAYVFDGARYPYPAALISDAMTFLSNDFLPAEHATGMYYGSSRVLGRNPAARLTLNACVMTGDVQKGASPSLWGGHENLLRSLEDLLDMPFNHSGPTVCLWTSRQGDGAWSATGYRAPVRNFSFSKMYNVLTNMPPGTPRVVAPGLLDWEMVRN
jgi:hypothetical protein